MSSSATPGTAEGRTYDLATFGEAQLRLTVPTGERLASASHLRLSPAGSEANVAGLLSQLGRHCAWASLVPLGALGDRFLRHYRSVGVDLSHVVRTPQGRLALYFLEPGAGQQPARVTYDRSHTPFREATAAQFDWTALLDTRLLFVTGITAALTPGTATLLTQAVHAAADRGVPIALDVNHRSTLWTPDEARAVLEPLMTMVDVLLCSRSDAHRVFGIVGSGAAVCAELRSRWAVPHVVSTDSVTGVYHAGPEGTREFPVIALPVIDRPGAGDAFVGGVLHGYLDGDVDAGIRRGQLAAAVAVTHHGDLTIVDDTDWSPQHGLDIVR